MRLLAFVCVGLVALTGSAACAAGSEDTSSRIAFSTTRDGNSEIYVMDADGSGTPTNLSNNAALDSTPAWSPDGAKIAFTSDRGRYGTDEIYVMDADGSNQTRLTNDPGNDDSPTWSPDGEKIAFTTGRNPGDFPMLPLETFQIYVMDSDGSEQVALTHQLTTVWFYFAENNPEYRQRLVWRPSWAPGGEKIAFVNERDDNLEIYVVNSDGSNQTRLTNDPEFDNLPTWSPDGEKIAFVSGRDHNAEIYVMDSDGSNQTRLTNDPETDYDPTWSPDGEKIAFASERDGNFEIYVMDSDGSNQTRLTNDPEMDRLPTWAPAGK